MYTRNIIKKKWVKKKNIKKPLRAGINQTFRTFFLITCFVLF